MGDGSRFETCFKEPPFKTPEFLDFKVVEVDCKQKSCFFSRRRVAVTSSAAHGAVVQHVGDPSGLELWPFVMS